MTGTEKKEKTTVTTIDEAVHYVAKTQDGWGVAMNGLEAEDGSDLDHAGVFGLPMLDFKITAKNITKARVRNKRGKWLEYKDGYKGLGDGSNITGIELVGKGYVFSVHIKGGLWLPAMWTSDVDGEVLATNGSVIDAIWIEEI